MSVAADRGALAFAEKLLGLLRQASFSATYKYAVILGLMDLCLEQSGRSGLAPSMLTTRQLAEKVVERYWPHTLPFKDARVLRQNSGGQAKILSLIDAFKAEQLGDPSVTIVRARLAGAEAFDRLLREVEWVLVEMPLPKLQRIGNEMYRFIYQINWDDEIRRGDFTSADFDNRILLIDHAGDHLVRLAGLIRPLVQREWTERVARLNSAIVEDSQLEDFLFGANRTSVGQIRMDLQELQNGNCFYCEDPLSGPSEVDHFVPWARYPNNAIENLVLTHPACNNAKRDHLAAAEHVDRWTKRTAAAGEELAAIAEARSWESCPLRSLSVARAIYLRLPEDARLWRDASVFVTVDRATLTKAFEREAA